MIYPPTTRAILRYLKEHTMSEIYKDLKCHKIVKRNSTFPNYKNIMSGNRSETLTNGNHLSLYYEVGILFPIQHIFIILKCLIMY